MSIQYTSESEVRSAFWQAHPQAKRRHSRWIGQQGGVYHGDVPQNGQPCDTRCAFVDFVDHLQKSGFITEELASQVTL